MIRLEKQLWNCSVKPMDLLSSSTRTQNGDLKIGLLHAFFFLLDYSLWQTYLSLNFP